MIYLVKVDMNESTPIESEEPVVSDAPCKCYQLFIDDNPVDVVHAVLSLVQKAVCEGKSIDDATLLEIERVVRKDYGNVSTYCAGKTPARVLSNWYAPTRRAARRGDPSRKPTVSVKARSGAMPRTLASSVKLRRHLRDIFDLPSSLKMSAHRPEKPASTGAQNRGSFQLFSLQECRF